MTLTSFERGIFYGLFGIFVEICWTSGKDSYKNRTLYLHGKTTLWMFFIYSLGLRYLFENGYDLLGDYMIPWYIRAPMYGIGFISVELVTGYILLKALHKCPWEYTSGYHVRGIIRLDYIPFWSALGLIMERVVDYIRN